MSILTEERSQGHPRQGDRSCPRPTSAPRQLSGSITGNIRFALNNVSTSGIVDDADLAVQVAFGKRVGMATINEFDDAVAGARGPPRRGSGQAGAGES